MEGLSYPTRNGIPINPFELELPESHLNPEAQRNYNNHHSCWTQKMFGRKVLYVAVRNLEVMQNHMLVDVHDWVHHEYDPPIMPTPQQAMHEIERAKDAGEMLQLRQPCKKGDRYHKEPIDDDLFKRCIVCYDALRREHK